MKSEKRILLAFLLNLGFSVFEFIGGVLTGSVAILSDAIHDVGDAFSIGASYALEKKSRRQPDEHYTYGYARYSVIGGLLTTVVLLVGSVLVTVHAVDRILHPTEIHYNGMILFAVIGVVVNFCAAFFTREGDSLNQRAVNLHMLEDVLGWAVVLVGALVMRFTDFAILDPLLSIGVAVFILVNAVRTLWEIIALFLEKTPHGIEIEVLKEHLLGVDGVRDVHHMHVWSMDGEHHYATMHIVTDADGHAVKAAVRAELAEHGIGHATLELETVGEECHEAQCHVDTTPSAGHHHHHHHHHHEHHGHHEHHEHHEHHGHHEH